PCVTESRKRFGACVHNCGTIGPVSALVSPNSRSSTGFAFKPPLTMRMLPATALPGNRLSLLNHCFYSAGRISRASLTFKGDRLPRSARSIRGVARMFESLFGAEMPLAVRFFVAFLIVLGVIGAIWWTVRRFGTGRLGASTRGRQPRLAVIDYASVDNRRRLILVRRDNVEHLLMIGGPSDIVVEPNIVRAVPAARDAGRAPAGIEAITRAIPLPDSGSGSWPLQPDAHGGPRPGPRPEAQHADLPGRPQSEPGPRQRDPLAALADELSTRITPPQRNRGNVGEPPRQDQRNEQRQDQRPEPRLEPRRPAQPA